MLFAPVTLLLLAFSFPSFSSDSKEVRPNCQIFPEKLDACEVYSCRYKHLLTRELLSRQLRRANRRCIFTEEWPNGSKLNCELGKKQMRALSKYYRIFDSASDVAYQPQKDPETGEPSTELRVNGEVVQNIPEEFVNQGICKITSPE